MLFLEGPNNNVSQDPARVRHSQQEPVDRRRREGVHPVERGGLDDGCVPHAVEGHAHVEGLLGHHGDARDTGGKKTGEQSLVDVQGDSSGRGLGWVN